MAFRLRVLTFLVCSLAVVSSGCAWKRYVGARTVRYVTGAPTRLHTITPPEKGLPDYTVVEFRELENLLPGQVPPALERRLNERIAGALRTTRWKPSVFAPDEVPSEPDAPPRPVLIFEGFIDDYDPGYRALRAVELGFNHVAVTVRFQLRDAQTGRVMAAASITAQDNRVTGTTRGAIDRIARKIRKFLDRPSGG
jgi:hypothetical protein